MTGPGATTAVVSVPAQDPAPPPGKGPEFGNASVVGLVVVLLLLIATAMLIRSMSKRIRKLPASFDEPGSGSPEDTDGTSGDTSATGSESRS
ncbi:hypothetical protein [Pseudonocardia endophytica]|uniref:hypothetical protein n=1 Tax=Pseudonocardia endophytica TaxID=401976 RepID=UPI001A9FEB01|nr:hypothetical protein [Pseudonocardia endophytica]